MLKLPAVSNQQVEAALTVEERQRYGKVTVPFFPENQLLGWRPTVSSDR